MFDVSLTHFDPGLCGSPCLHEPGSGFATVDIESEQLSWGGRLFMSRQFFWEVEQILGGARKLGTYTQLTFSVQECAKLTVRYYEAVL